jgi:hypothetical protein
MIELIGERHYALFIWASGPGVIGPGLGPDWARFYQAATMRAQLLAIDSQSQNLADKFIPLALDPVNNLF